MDMDWHTGQSQAGQKGRQLEVGAWLTSLLVSDSICEWGDGNVVKPPELQSLVRLRAWCVAEKKTNSQSLEDTQVRYMTQKYTLEKKHFGSKKLGDSGDFLGDCGELIGDGDGGNLLGDLLGDGDDLLGDGDDLLGDGGDLLGDNGDPRSIAVF